MCHLCRGLTHRSSRTRAPTAVGVVGWRFAATRQPSHPRFGVGRPCGIITKVQRGTDHPRPDQNADRPLGASTSPPDGESPKRRTRRPFQSPPLSRATAMNHPLPQRFSAAARQTSRSCRRSGDVSAAVRSHNDCWRPRERDLPPRKCPEVLNGAMGRLRRMLCCGSRCRGGARDCRCGQHLSADPCHQAHRRCRWRTQRWSYFAQCQIRYPVWIPIMYLE
jgi:hypothetical protein